MDGGRRTRARCRNASAQGGPAFDGQTQDNVSRKIEHAFYGQALDLRSEENDTRQIDGYVGIAQQTRREALDCQELDRRGKTTRLRKARHELAFAQHALAHDARSRHDWSWDYRWRRGRRELSA